MKKKFKISIIAGLIAISGLLVAFEENDFEIVKNLDIFYSLFREVTINYVDETDPAQLIENSINGMLKALDPYTNFIPESKLEDYRFMQTGQYGGVGAVFRKRNGNIELVETYLNSPAAKAGLISGDIILKVEGRNVSGKSIEDLSEIFKGQPNTELSLDVLHPGKTESERVRIIREKIEIKAVPHFQVLENGVGYIRLNSFTNKAFIEVKEAFVTLKEEHEIKGLILDLRNNPGGLLIEAVKIVNLFVPKGQEVVSTRGKLKSQEHTYKTMGLPLDADMPVAVLVNSKSASASEIVSGTLQDLDRAVIIGTRTFGKGLVQTTRDLSYNSKLKITTAKYYIPSGRCIQALDYSHRNPDGSVGKVPDSLISKFSTRNGRVVYDGGGISPDIILRNKKFSTFAKVLYAKNYIFDFVTDYCLNRDSVAPPKDFVLTNEDYQIFKDFVKEKDFHYQSRSEKAFKKLKAIAEQEKYLTRNEKLFNDLEIELTPNIESDLELFKDDIIELISEEILVRYYFEPGNIEYQLNSDKLVKKGIEVLTDKDKYREILSGSIIRKDQK